MVKEPPDVGIIALAGALSSYIFGPEAAVYVGPYVVILLASTVGASFSLGRRETSAKGNAMWFFLRINILAILVTVGAAAALSTLHAGLNERLLIAPVAFIIGFIGDDWPKLLKVLAGKISAFIDVLIKLKGGNNG